MLDIRFRLPPMHNFCGKFFAIDLNSGTVKMILANELFSSNVNSEMTKADLLCRSPEEILTQEKTLTTPFWALGCQIYQAYFGFNPFRTHLGDQVAEKLITLYPVMFPED